ncbi:MULTISPECIES: regulatory protein RecX [Paenibacillus]|uniref:regulatory protein RecX n=1 Tax=Paenibacillus TaxID=44249 RepID=UPI002FE1B402
MQRRWGGGGSRHSQNRGKEEASGIVDISEEGFWEEDRGRHSIEPKTGGAQTSGSEAGGIDSFPEGTELTITSVLLLKRPKFRYRISFGPYALEVHEDVMIKYRMIKGAVFTKSELEEIVLADERQRAYADALQYLGRKPRTAYEMTIRLGEKGWNEETVAGVVGRLTEEGLLNDAAYAQEWAGQRVRNRGKGKMWVKHELRQKGISKPLIEDALGAVSEEDEYASAKELAVKKWRTSTGEAADKKRKTGAFLLRRGFSGSLVSRVVRELAQGDGLHEEEEWEDI